VLEIDRSDSVLNWVGQRQAWVPSARRGKLRDALADPAVLSVIFTGTVGVLGAATAAAGHLVTLRNEDHKRREARREDVRSVLDDAAAIALRSEHELTPAQTFREISDRISEDRAAIATQLGRLGVRVGPSHAVYRHLDRYEDLLGRIENGFGCLPADQSLDKLREMSDLPPGAASRDVVKQALSAFEAAEWREADTAIEELKKALEDFLAAAHELAGAG
jgi:hypothetical protein